MPELIELQNPATSGHRARLVIQFPLGLPGCESGKDYLLAATPSDSPVLELRMLEGSRHFFQVIRPGLILRDYQPDISDQDADFLGLKDPADALVLNIVTRHETGITVNLREPIVINRLSLIGKQVIPRNAANFETGHLITQFKPAVQSSSPRLAPPPAPIVAKAPSFRPVPGLAPNADRRVAEHYFPNQSAEMQAAENELRRTVANRPESERLRIYSAFSRSARSLQPTDFSEAPDMILARQRGREIAYPRPVPMVKLSHIVFGYEQWLERKYCLPGFVSVEPGDIVIDCGAYVGGFSLSASKVAKEVHLFEPDEANFACVKFNFKGVNNCVLNLAGLYNKSETKTLNISASSVEHSLLAPDDGVTIATRQIQVVSLHDYCQSRKIETLDFVKIEAEGVELEVFEGLEAIRPRKLAIDVSPERDGESPAAEFKVRLAKMNYEFRQRANVLFARRCDSGATSSPRPPASIKTKPLRQSRQSFTRPVPRQIYSMWLQGVEQAPPLVRWNLARWQSLNTGYDVTVLNAQDVAGLLRDSGIPWQNIAHQALSDVVRANLLVRRGGIWVDASVLPARPLEAWLPQAVAQSSFLAFRRPGPDRPLSSWFLAASPEHELTVKWWDEVRRFWSGKRVLAQYGGNVIPPDPVATVSPATQKSGEYPYFWFHYLFDYLIRTDKDFANVWSACHQLSADAAHTLQTLFASPTKPAVTQMRAALQSSPVHKLNWRVNYPIEELDKMLRNCIPARADDLVVTLQ